MNGSQKRIRPHLNGKGDELTSLVFSNAKHVSSDRRDQAS